MRVMVRASVEALTALVYMASFAVVIGTFATIYTQSLRTSLLIAATAFISATLGFAYSLWRLHRPRWPIAT